jgi:hypothetical protein
LPSHHGQSEKETSSEDEQAQAPEALEGESPQEAHMAEVSRALRRRSLISFPFFQNPSPCATGFSFFARVS